MAGKIIEGENERGGVDQTVYVTVMLVLPDGAVKSDDFLYGLTTERFGWDMKSDPGAEIGKWAGAHISGYNSSLVDKAQV